VLIRLGLALLLLPELNTLTLTGRETARDQRGSQREREGDQELGGHGRLFGLRRGLLSSQLQSLHSARLI
jgi:hypothetical protein